MKRTSLLRVVPVALVALALTACPEEPPKPPQDTVAPTVKSIEPADGASAVATHAKIVVTFSEAVEADSVEAALLDGETAVDGELSVDGSKATFTPAAALRENGAFTFKLDAYADKAGNAGEAASSSFTTAATDPTVAETSPADGAINVPTSTTVSATFSKDMDADSINETSFLLADGTTPVAGAISYASGERVATFTPSKPLFESRVYTATLTTDLVDANGTHLASSRVWSFTTAATVPTVTGITPADMTTDVAGNAAITVTFSEDMDPATFTDASFQVAVQGGAAIPGSYTWDAPNHAAIFQPDGAYPGGAVITVTLTPEVKDVSGIALASNFSASFTVSNAPAVSDSTPAPNETGVSLGTSVALTFSQPMNVTTLTNANVWIEDAAQQKLAATYVPTATTLTLTPSTALDESTVYTVVVTTGVTSATGVPFDSEYRFSFTTLGIPPQIVAVSPAAGATDVPVNAKVNLTFSEDMDTATFTAANVRLSDGAADVAATLNVIDARNVELTPDATLLETSAYTIIASTSLVDLHGNPLSSEFRTSFTTEPLPRIVSINPAPNATGVAAGSALVMVANKDLDASTVTITPATGSPLNTVTVYEDGAVIEGAIQYEAATRSIRITRTSLGAPGNWTAGKRYTVVVDGAALKDLTGNAVGGVISTSFVAGSAADTAAPTITAVDPQQGQIGVARNHTPSATFSEPIDPTTLSSSNVTLKQGSTAIAGRLEYVEAQNRVVFIPAQQLPANTQLTFSVGTGIEDLSGNAKVGTNAVTFTTQPNSEPTLAGISPADAATDVEVNVAVRLAFSEPVDPATLNVELSDGTNLIQGALTYDDATASAVFTPSADLPAGAAITVTVKAGLADKEGLATTADLTRTFNTIANSAHDVTIPAVSSTVPADAATGVSARPTIQISFSEPLDPTTVSVSQFSIEAMGGTKIPFGLSYQVGSDTASLTPSVALQPGTAYSVKVQGGLTDLAGNALDAMAASSTFGFTVDGTSPTVVSRNPTSGSTVGGSVGVALVFSEDMNPATIDAASITLSQGTTEVLASVWYDASGRTAFLRPAAKLLDGTYTVDVDGARVADLAGNTVADSYSFTVSSTGPSVVSVSPCGSVVDADDFGNTTISVTFDPGVKKAGGGALDSGAVQLRVAGSAVAANVSHTAGQTVATLTPSAALTQDTVYEVFIDKTLVQDASTSAAMASDYSCTFRTQRIIFEDDMDPMPASMWTAQVSGTNAWKALNSVSDPQNATVVFRGSNATDGQNYTRTCDVFGGTAQSLVLERDVTLPNLSSVKLRLDEWHEMGASPNDAGRVVVVFGGNPITLATFTGSGASAYQAKEYDLTPYKNATVKLRFVLDIGGGSSLGNCAAGGKGLYVDNIRIVGE